MTTQKAFVQMSCVVEGENISLSTNEEIAAIGSYAPGCLKHVFGIADAATDIIVALSNTPIGGNSFLLITSSFYHAGIVYTMGNTAAGVPQLELTTPHVYRGEDFYNKLWTPDVPSALVFDNASGQDIEISIIQIFNIITPAP